jgi:two-component sensor histidine kinase
MADAEKVVRSRAAIAALALLCAFMAIFAVLIGYVVYRTYSDTADRVRDRAESGARIMGNSAGWIYELSQQTLLRVDVGLGNELLRGNLGPIEDLRETVSGLPQGADVYVVDTEGNALFSTIPNAERVSVADRSYFTELAEGDSFYTSPMITSRLTGQQIFVFSRRLERDGQFVGAAIMSYDQSVIGEVWQSLDFDPASTISLVRSDGQLMARFPQTDGEVDLRNHVLFTEYLPQADSGTYSARSPIDGSIRTASYRRVPGTDMIAMAAVSGAAWDAFWRQAILLALLAVPVGTALAIGSVIIIRLLRRDQKRQEELEAANETNILLFREIHHRVKNNLQSVQSLVRMQDIPQQAKLDLQSRFAAMAAMHEHIYQHDEYLDIVASDYVPAIVQPIVKTYGDNADISFDIDPVLIDRDHATPLALLLSELVTNALKYAFADGNRGEIAISLKAGTGGRSTLTVADNGVGFATDPDEGSMGMRLIKGIVAQLNGTYSFANDGGTRFTADIWLSQAARKAAAE